MTHYEVIIIGAGPAGMSAANILKDEKRVLIVDEYYHYGGRLLGQLYEESKGSWWNGMDVAKHLHDVLDEKITLQLETSVYNVEKEDTEFTVFTNKGDFTSDYLIVATGAKENSYPLPGWELPGVMTVGAAQVLTNFHRVAPGDAGVIIGINPLSMVIGMELGYADIEVRKICLPAENKFNTTTPKDALLTLMGLGRSAPTKLLSIPAGIGSRMSPFHGMALKLFPSKGIKALGLPLSIKERVIKINGRDSVESVTTVKTNSDGSVIEGSEQEIKCDFVCISDGLSPVNEITSLFNLKHAYLESLGGYVPIHSEQMETEVDKLYVAGNITGIENAKVAMLQGEMAAHHISGNEAAVKNTLKSITNERKNAKVKFHKNLDAGRDKLQLYWLAK